MSTDVRRALVLDDEAPVAALLASVVEMAGLAADVVTDPETLLDHLTNAHELVVLDLAMGRTDGIAVMTALQEHAPDAAVILVSGVGPAVLDSSRRVAEMLGLRVVATFAKPVTVTELRDAIVEWATSTPPPATHAAVRHEVDVDALLSGRGLWPAYQPKVEIASRRIIGAEALLRWTAPSGASVPPIDVVRVVEAEGRSPDLLRLVAAHAAADRLAHPVLAGLDDVSINVSSHDLVDDDLPDVLVNVLAEGAPPERWTLELTETSPLIEAAPSLSVLTRFRLRGFGLAIDDFGAGSSTFERLIDLPFTELKIDRLLVALLSSGQPADESLVRSTIDFGHARDVQVVAEGIETVDQFAQLRALGCDIAQGYLLARPSPPIDFPNSIADPEKRHAT